MTEFELLDELSLSNSIFEIITSKCTCGKSNEAFNRD